ncbi:hypothetical protein CGLO_13872 [Colletotrichum gloeosporioides Cg-14]|uniref:Uncharacterized protein n=1 Tax=Colletotrichum gloeosporioides (strain Cg-14) TaxID=1237896 RepID=T0JVK3_COLGC|nr:hypothetical protein CGLO_13872 [Colletotrichum gloeosporioides Cg-14]
MMMDFVNVNTK